MLQSDTGSERDVSSPTEVAAVPGQTEDIWGQLPVFLSVCGCRCACMCVCVCGCVCGCVFLSIFVHVYIFMPVPSVFVAMLSQQTLKLPGCMLCGRTEASNAETELQESTDQLRFQLTGEMHTSHLSTRKGSNTTLPTTGRYLSPVLCASSWSTS